MLADVVPASPPESVAFIFHVHVPIFAPPLHVSTSLVNVTVWFTQLAHVWESLSVHVVPPSIESQRVTLAVVSTSVTLTLNVYVEPHEAPEPMA
ncbi:Uncharacterised protein [uncultured archaeon]|nr:Uncharacterised protein [uncultured archaeon]